MHVSHISTSLRFPSLHGTSPSWQRLQCSKAKKLANPIPNHNPDRNRNRNPDPKLVLLAHFWRLSGDSPSTGGSRPGGGHDRTADGRLHAWWSAPPSAYMLMSRGRTTALRESHAPPCRVTPATAPLKSDRRRCHCAPGAASTPLLWNSPSLASWVSEIAPLPPRSPPAPPPPQNITPSYIFPFLPLIKR